MIHEHDGYDFTEEWFDGDLFITNLQEEKLPLFREAIAKTKADLSIGAGSHGCESALYHNVQRCDLSSFWRTFEALDKRK